MPRPRNKPPTNAHAAPVVGFVALGCAKNLVDSEKMLGQIAESGAIISTDESAADTVVVNTCGFLGAARDEALGVISELAERKRRGDLKRIIVAGCLVQRDGEQLLETVPEIDALVGVNNRDNVADAVWGLRRGAVRPAPPAQTGRSVPAAVSAPGGPRAMALPLAQPSPRATKTPAPDLFLGDYHPQPWSDQGRLRLTPRHYAYVRISEGCNQKCTFCTIPSIRGPLHSKTPDALVAECRELIADGARELILIGQDTTSYGLDIGYEPGLAGLLRRLDAECDGARWLRLMYVYPSIFTDEVIDAIAECRRIVKYIDIPLQHASDRMLRAMGRRVSRRRQDELLQTLRRRIPGVTIRTTFIVGFPGETDADFAELLQFVRDAGFDAAGAFEYSLEPETPSGRMKDQLAADVKKARYERLMLAQQEMALTAARRRLGQTLELVIDQVNADTAVGRHAGQAPEVDSLCLTPRSDSRATHAASASKPHRRRNSKRPSGRDYRPGDLLTARVVDTQGYDLIVDPLR